MKIKTKLFLNTSLSVATILILFTANILIAQKMAFYNQLSLTVKDVETKLQLMRVSVSKSYAEGDTSEQLQNFNDARDSLFEAAEEIGKYFVTNKIASELVNNVKSSVRTYNSIYSDSYRILKVDIGDGISESESGLTMAAIKLARSVESYVKRSGSKQGMVYYLQARRFAKGYLVNLSEDTFTEWEESLNNLERYLSVILSGTNKSNATAALRKYRDTFLELREKLLKVKIDLEEERNEASKACRDNTHELLEFILLFAHEQSEFLNYLLSAFMLAAVFAIAVIAGLIQKSIIGSVSNLSSVMRYIRENNDMTERVKKISPDEMGEISEKLNEMLSSLQTILQEVSVTISTINKSCNQLTSSIDSSVKSAEKQLSETDMVATAATEMVATINEIAANTEKMKTLTLEANENATEGFSEVKQTVQSIQHLADNLNAASSDVNQLDADSQSIGDVLSVISDIAEQTNLLALNAAIEAARAGEQGRGFAVVADEVRTLAGKTQEATSEIGKIIEKLQTSTKNIVDVVVKGQAESLDCAQKSGKTGDILKEIADKVTEIMDMSTTVAAAIEEQSSVSSEMGQNMVTIKDLVNESSLVQQENSKSTTALQEQANMLYDKISEFKL